jgi:uncharacterized protein
MLELEAHPRGVILPVRAHAGARRNAILGVREGMLRVAVTAAPEKGKANDAIVALLSRELNVPKASLALVAGPTSAKKRFLIEGGRLDELRARIAALVGDQSDGD